MDFGALCEHCLHTFNNAVMSFHLETGGMSHMVTSTEALTSQGSLGWKRHMYCNHSEQQRYTGRRWRC